jgi:hypothetical protein
MCSKKGTLLDFVPAGAFSLQPGEGAGAIVSLHPRRRTRAIDGLRTP